MTYRLKKATHPTVQAAQDQDITRAVEAILSDVEKRGDQAVRDYARKFDHDERDDFRLSKAEIEACVNSLSAQERTDIEFAQQQVGNFAKAQKDCLRDLELETLPGVVLGHKNVPIEHVGCYIPGGKYPLLASAHMSVLTARIAGCDRVITCAPPFKGRPAEKIVASQYLAGADEIYCLGGVQAIAAMAMGTESIQPVDMIAGPGNAYVAEAKRLLFGRIGIDLFAGPTETLLIADQTVDGELCATDLLGQAEHGPDSPTVLITNSLQLGRDTLVEIERQLETLDTAAIAGQAWEKYGEIIICDSDDEMLAEANHIASEHVQIMVRNPDFFKNNLKNYGALFIGPRTNVSYGDKVIGTNHTLPTRKAARYTGGLWVGKFMKTCSYQEITTDEASVEIGEYCARLCDMEGFTGHGDQARLRVRRYGPKDHNSKEVGV